MAWSLIERLLDWKNGAKVGTGPGQLSLNGEFDHVYEGINAAGDYVDDHKTATVLDHPDNSVTDAKIGERTVSDATAPTTDAGTLAALLGYFANLIKGVTGETTWRTAPATTLKDAKAHNDAEAPHTGYYNKTAIDDKLRGIVVGQVPDKSVTPEKLSFDPATQAELDDVSSTLSATTTTANTAKSTADTAKATAEAAIPKGTGNQSVSEVLAMLLETHTRTPFFTYTGDKLTKVEEKDGSTVVRTTTLNYTGDQLTSVVETANGKTITITLNYNPDGTLSSAPRVVV